MEQGQQINAPYPRPPPFYEHFTADNLAHLEAIRQDGRHFATQDGVENKLRVEGVTSEIQILLPPEPPTSGQYQTFGQRHSLSETLQSLPEDVERLIPSEVSQAERPQELLKLSKSILLKFLELVGALNADPQGAQVKIDDLRTLFYNTHYLVNQYRPHQARESLIAMMEDQLQRKRDEIDGVRKMREKVDEQLGSLGGQDLPDSLQRATPAEEEREKDELRRKDQRQVWRALETIEI